MPKLIIIIITIITIDHATTTYFNVTIIKGAIMSNNLPPERPAEKMFENVYCIFYIFNS